MKKCSKCKETKDCSEFSRNKSRKDGLHNYCRECDKEKRKHFYSCNPDYKRDYKNNRLPTNYAISEDLRRNLRSAISYNVKSGKTIELLGCSIEFLKGYLTGQFTEEMSWDNYGEVWTIDHAMPFRYFDLTKEDELKIVCHWTNLRPMLKADNYSRKYDVPRIICELPQNPKNIGGVEQKME